jgi:Ser/Thr protein kinase RdoA (MazF antagonist)
VECVAPTLNQEDGPDAKSLEDKRAELAALPAEQRLTNAEVDTIRMLGDNTGRMALKGASPQHTGEEQPDRWTLDEHLAAVAERWRIDPSRDLVMAGAA